MPLAHARRDGEHVRARVRGRCFISFAAAAAAPNVPIVPVRVEAALVVIGVDGLGDLALDLEPDEKRLEKRARPDAFEPFGDGERGGERRHGRVRQQAEGAVRRRRELRVVVVHRVAARAVDERGRCAARRCDLLRSENRRPRFARSDALMYSRAIALPRTVGAGQHHTKAVAIRHRSPRPPSLRHANIGKRRRRNEVDDRCCGAPRKVPGPSPG